MLIRSFPAPMFATNCWVIAPAAGGECIIVDPGMPDISADIEMIIEENMQGTLGVRNSDRGAVFTISLDLNMQPSKGEQEDS